MTRRLLPFEDRYRTWAVERGIGWSEERVEYGPGRAASTAYRLTPPAEPRRTVLALHGAGNDALFGWVGLFRRLLLDGAEVFSVELPGHGRGGTSHFTSEAARALIGRSVEVCSERGGGRPLHTVGVSLGAACLLHALPDLGPSLASAALVVAPLEIRLSPRTVLRELTPATAAFLWSERRDYGITGLIPSFGPFKREIYPLRLPEPGRGAFGYVGVLNRQLADARLLHRARDIPTPVLLVYGGRDLVVPAEQGERLAAALPDARLHIEPQSTHLSTPMLDSTLETLVRWFREHG